MTNHGINKSASLQMNNSTRKIQNERSSYRPNRSKEEQNSSTDSSIITSLNRSRDSGFFQEGPISINDNFIPSLNFENFSSNRRSNFVVRSKRNHRFESRQEFERPKSMDYYDERSPEVKSLYENEQLRNQGLTSKVNRIGVTPSRSDIFVKKMIDRNNSTLLSHDFKELNCNQTRRTSDFDPDDMNFYESLENYNHQSIVTNPQARKQRENSNPWVEQNVSTDSIDYKKIKQDSPEICSTMVYDNEADISEEEEMNQNLTNNNSLKIGSLKSPQTQDATRSFSASVSDSKVTRNDLIASNRSSTQGENLFNMFGAKLSDVCRQLLLSDYKPPTGTNGYETIDKQKSSSGSIDTTPSSQSNPCELQIDSLLIIDHADVNHNKDLKSIIKKPERNSTLIVGEGENSTSLEFSLKVDRQPTWSMAPAPPEPSEHQSLKKDYQVPLYCAFVRYTSLDNTDHKKSFEPTNSESMNMVDSKNKHCDNETMNNFDYFEAKKLSDISEFKSNKDSNIKIHESKVNKASINDDAKDLIESKQTPLFETARRSHFVKTLKTLKRSKSQRERSVSRRRKEYLHEIGLEVFKTIEEELRISHRWNGVSPAETIARRFEQILGSHQQRRVDLGLTEPSNQELCDLLTDRINFRDQDYFSHKKFPYRSLSAPRDVENLLRGDSGFNLERRLALLLRCAHLEASGQEIPEDLLSRKEPHTPIGILERDNNYKLQDIYPREVNSRFLEEGFQNYSNLPSSINNDINNQKITSEKPAKKTEVMQTRIPLNDKLLEIVLKVSEPYLADSSNSTKNNSPVRESFSRHKSFDIRDIGSTQIKIKIPNREETIVESEISNEDFKDEKFENKKIVVVAQSEEPTTSIHFKVSNSLPAVSKSKFKIHDLNEETSEYDEERNENDLRLEKQYETETLNNVKIMKQMFTESLVPMVTERDEIFEKFTNDAAVSLSNKSYHSLSLENKLKDAQKRRINILLSNSSDAGDGNISTPPPPTSASDANKQITEQLGQEFATMDQKVLDINNNNNNDNIIINDNNNDNNNSRKIKKNISTSDDYIFCLGSKQMTKRSALLDQIQKSKRVTFSEKMNNPQNHLDEVRKNFSDKTIAENSDSSHENARKNNDSKDCSDSQSPNQVIMISKYLDFTGNTETNGLNTSCSREYLTSSTYATPNQTPNQTPMQTPDPTSLVPDSNLTEITKSSDSKQIVESETTKQSMDPLLLTTQSSKAEPTEIAFIRPIKVKMGLPIYPDGTPSPPRIIRKLNAVKVTNFGTAKNILKRAFKDKHFGKALDDHDVIPVPYVASKIKFKKLKKIGSDDEFKNVKVQTESLYGFILKEKLIGKKQSFFSVKLGMAIFTVLMAIVIFYLIGRQL